MFFALGTWVAAIFSPCLSIPNKEGSKMKTFGLTLLCGFLQLILAPVIVGMLWSIK